VRLTHAAVDIVYILDMGGVQPELAVLEADTENVYNDLLAAGDKLSRRRQIVENTTRALLSRGVDEKGITVAVLEGNP
jgi:hypothetical protein